MKKVFGTIAFISFFLLLGTVGSIEKGVMELGTGNILCVVYIAVFALFTWLADGFYQTKKADRKSPPISKQN